MKGYQSFSMIDFLEWIKQPVVDEICGIGRVIWLTGSTYQPLLVQRILLLFKKQGFIVYHSQSEQEIDSCLHTVSFVEQRVFYWMSDITGYEAARRDLLLKRAYGYQGVPWIGFFSSSRQKKRDFLVLVSSLMIGLIRNNAVDCGRRCGLVMRLCQVGWEN